MFRHSTVRRLKRALLTCAAGTAFLASPALAQQVDPNKLLELMVAKGLVTRAEADAMITEATTTAPVQQAQALPPVPAGGVDAAGVQTVPYVPKLVREQIKKELRDELGQQAQAEGWSRPGETPEWTRRITLYGDVRARGEGRFYDKNNADIFENFGAINSGNPQNINDATPGWVPPAFLNTREDRQRGQLRARLGVKAKIADWISANVRIATGNDGSPVSTNQTLGSNGGAGYQLWLDRASIRLNPAKDVNLDFGRFGNPFFTTDLLFDPDMGFDGVALSSRAALGKTFAVFSTLGAFPVFNTDLNFGSRNAPVDSASSGPYKSQDRYLLAAQAGFEVHPNDQVNLRLAGGYFHYTNAQGKISAPCQFYEVSCSTDATRPAFQQFGNTMFPIRDIVADPLNPVTSPENQYFGLASDFRILNIHGAVDYVASDHFGMRLEGDYVKNLGWKRAAVAPLAVNNLGPSTRGPDPTDPTKIIDLDGPYAGGNSGWQARLTVGSALALNSDSDGGAIEKGGWNLMLAYRRLQSDAVMDAFADSDFGLGGTNVKGWYLGGNYAIGHNTMVGARWVSSDEVVDAPLSIDRLFIDLLTRF
jgi:hypothetical protein